MIKILEILLLLIGNSISIAQKSPKVKDSTILTNNYLTADTAFNAWYNIIAID